MKQIMNGCTAATHVAFALSDVGTIYPITPIASMGEVAQKWAMEGRKNYMGVAMRVEEMESELGAAGATHGALAAGSLATTFTNSQGLMLMISNMYKMAGNRLPAVFHVGTRSLATHALSIFGDHQDVMATRATGFAFLASASVQETMDLALVAHLAAVQGRTPVCHFFDGWRTSNEMSTIDVIDYNDIWPLIEWEHVHAFRRDALNPEHPVLRGTAQGPDVYFQNTEAQNSCYTAFPAIVQRQMDRVAAVTGRQYHVFDYYGAADAEIVLVSMGSSTEVIEQTIDTLNTRGYKAGLVKVRLFRPFDVKAMLAALPKSVKTIVVLDRTKEPGSNGEPLFQDVASAILQSPLKATVNVIGGRYGLSSKDFTPAMVKGVYDEARKKEPRQFFTVGINDDVTHLSIDYDPAFTLVPEGMSQAVFYGIGADGTVGATKQVASIIGNSSPLYAQVYFNYSAKKSGGYTISELRFGPRPIRAEYQIEQADYVGCNKDTYVSRFDLLHNLRQGGTFVLNCPWTDQQLETKLPASLRRSIAQHKARFYTIDATAVAQKTGLGVRINMIMETIFLRLSNVLPFEKALPLLKQEISKTYLHEGNEVVQKNLAAVDMAVEALHEVTVPATWLTAKDPQGAQAPLSDADAQGAAAQISTSFKLPYSLGEFVAKVATPCLKLEGDKLPVSAFAADGRMPMGTAAYEKRCIAINVPVWDMDKCVECAECSLVCPHAAIRPVLLTAAEAKSAPKGFTSKPCDTCDALKPYNYRIQVYPADCEGCGSCALVCPGHALTMVPLHTQLATQEPLVQYFEKNIPWRSNLVPRFTVDGSQFHQPLMEFSGACAGCGETPYVKLITQLFGERMIIANATGCSSIWGAYWPSNPYCTRKCDGRGPAWGNSLFEDNAEYGYGMAVSCRQRREALAQDVTDALRDASITPGIKKLMKEWLENFHDPELSHSAGQALVKAIEADTKASANSRLQSIVANSDMLGRKSVWAVGGDGWAYDIGFAGLDHVLASGEDINILVLDTECYSNTGGQRSKATPLGAVVKYSAQGKRTFKKDLGRMMMTYGNVYVASIALGGNFQQAIDALREAEAYPGPSIVICYCPCIEHGIRLGLGHSILEERAAVKCGYWPLYRYNPLLAQGDDDIDPYIEDTIAPHVALDGLPANGTPSKAENADAAAVGEGPWDDVDAETSTMTVDCEAPQGGATAFNAYLDGEDRYADIRLVTDPVTAQRLRESLRHHTLLRYSLLKGQQDTDRNVYDPPATPTPAKPK